MQVRCTLPTYSLDQIMGMRSCQSETNPEVPMAEPNLTLHFSLLVANSKNWIIDPQHLDQREVTLAIFTINKWI